MIAMVTKNDFKTIPDESDIAGISRDLRFHPSDVAEPFAALTGDQIKGFNDNGYVKGVRIFDSDEIAKIRGSFDDILARVSAAGGDSYSISSAHLTYALVYDLLKEPRIVACVRDLLGDDIIGWGSHFFCKMPRDGKSVAWHQDASYWPLSPSKTVTVWLAIDDADVENACMRFIAGSHWKGHLTYRPSSPEEHNVLNQTVDNIEQYGEEVIDDLSAGEISIHSDLLLHGSETNHSDRRRCGLTLRYCTPDVRAEKGWNTKGVVISGTDPDSHWGNPPRPES
ncbi:MAG: non-heme Fe2+,alpha-ketoglutarate-dependent halogenase [Verrucomicrobiales bacterium]|jgi:non-heme Fe2+,alpha-ketoglutarate-dependent halogenase